MHNGGISSALTFLLKQMINTYNNSRLACKDETHTSVAFVDNNYSFLSEIAPLCFVSPFSVISIIYAIANMQSLPCNPLPS